MLKIVRIRSGYRGIEILHGLDIEVRAEEIVALIGPNGAGKSTLLKTIFNLCEIYSGGIVYQGRDITGAKTYELIRQGISYVPQGRQIFSNLTVLENLEMGAFITKNENAMRQNMDHIFRRFPFLGRRRSDYAYALSGGEQQILAIARVLMQNTKLLLLDEPTLGLAPKMMREIFSITREINADGIAVILIEQNARQAVAIADRTYVLEDGAVAIEGGKKILEDRRVKDIYFGDA